MADSSNSIPVSEPYNPFFEALLNDDQSYLLADLSHNEHFSYSSLPFQNPLEVNVPPSTPMIHVPVSPPRVQDSFPTITNREKAEAGSSRRPVKRCRTMAELMESTRPSQPRNPTSNLTETSNSNPFLCGCCHVLREIIHTNGLQYHKLEVHGRIGMICHAIFHQDVQEGSSNANRFQMFDFSNKNIEEIKYFLEEHCLRQRSLGYTLVPDPLSDYYEALCVGLEWTKTQNESLDSSFQINIENVSSKGKEPEVENDLQGDYSGLKLSNTYRATMEQRDRIAAMSLKDFSNFFHLTLEETSRQMNLSVHAIKKICHKGGLEDWPYKKLQKFIKQLYSLTEKLPRENTLSRVAIQGEIRRVQSEMVKLCGGVVPAVALIAENNIVFSS